MRSFPTLVFFAIARSAANIESPARQRRKTERGEEEEGECHKRKEVEMNAKIHTDRNTTKQKRRSSTLGHALRAVNIKPPDQKRGRQRDVGKREEEAGRDESRHEGNDDERGRYTQDNQMEKEKLYS